MSDDAPNTGDTHLLCAGVGLRGSGYPNAINTLHRLRRAGVAIDDRVDWLPEGFQLWRAARGSLLTKLRLYGKLLIGNALAAARLCFGTSNARTIAYIPYPAVFLLWWLSWVPRRWRPKLIADAYISVWDTMVRDRGMMARERLSSRLLKRFEGRALRAANAVLTDTVANRDWMIEAFGLDPNAVHSIPLAIDDTPLLAIPPRQSSSPLRVIFIGTFVPLHGADVLTEVARKAKQYASRFTLHFIGDGQGAAPLEQLLTEDSPGFTWERTWLSHAQIAERIAQCDVCLGVFGGAEKAARVLPFKLYLALAAGRCILTQRRFSLPEGMTHPPMETVEANPDHILAHLLALADDPARIARRATEARAFYLESLGEQATVRFWKQLLARIGGRSESA